MTHKMWAYDKMHKAYMRSKHNMLLTPFYHDCYKSKCAMQQISSNACALCQKLCRTNVCGQCNHMTELVNMFVCPHTGTKHICTLQTCGSICPLTHQRVKPHALKHWQHSVATTSQTNELEQKLFENIIFELFFGTRRLTIAKTRFKAHITDSKRQMIRYMRHHKYKVSIMSAYLLYKKMMKQHLLPITQFKYTAEQKMKVVHTYVEKIILYFSCLRTFSPLIKPINFAVTFLYIMRNGIKVHDSNIIMEDHYLRLHLPDVHSINRILLRKIQFTQCTTMLLKIIHSNAVAQQKLMELMC